jgi:hypothetical protein
VYFADFDGRNTGVLHIPSERRGVFGGDRDEKASGGLRVEEQSAEIFGH